MNGQKKTCVHAHAHAHAHAHTHTFYSIIDSTWLVVYHPAPHTHTHTHTHTIVLFSLLPPAHLPRSTLGNDPEIVSVDLCPLSFSLSHCVCIYRIKAQGRCPEIMYVTPQNNVWIWTGLCHNHTTQHSQSAVVDVRVFYCMCVCVCDADSRWITVGVCVCVIAFCHLFTLSRLDFEQTFFH